MLIIKILRGYRMISIESDNSSYVPDLSPISDYYPITRYLWQSPSRVNLTLRMSGLL